MVKNQIIYRFNITYFHFVSSFVKYQIFNTMLTKTLKITDTNTGKKKKVTFKAGPASSGTTTTSGGGFKAGADLQGKVS